MQRFVSVSGKGLSLFATYAVEYGAPFVRMIILSHALSLTELGTASALMVTYATFEQVTDIAIFRFVYSSPREKFAEALASAHALSLLRGVFVGALALALAPFAARLFGSELDVQSFRLLGLVVFLRSFENLEPRVAERDYQYGPQLKLNLISNGLGLLVMTGVALATRSHAAIVASLLAQSLGALLASHALSKQHYRLVFRSPFFKAGWRFAYPLMFNGLGLATTALGDRFVVGAFFGVETLAIYSVSMLATVIPISFVAKVGNSLCQAALYNASATRPRFVARLRFMARLTPLVAASYGLGIVALANDVIGLVFGKVFMVDYPIIVLLALGAFFKIAHLEPLISLLLHEFRTAALAAANLSSISGLVVGAALSLLSRSLGSALLGRLVGEIACLWTMFTLAAEAMGEAKRDFLVSGAAALAALVAACALVFILHAEGALTMRLAVCGTLALLFAAWTAVRTWPFVRAGFGKGE